MFNIVKQEELQLEDLPEQDWNLVQLMADRHVRATEGMTEWAKTAKKCIDYVENRQYTADEIATAESEGRPHLVFNKMDPLFRLMSGYHRNNRVDAQFLPDDVGNSSESTAQALTKLDKRTCETNQSSYVDTEVFADGIITGRGFYDQRLDFTDNALGELKITARDPSTIKLDPDGDTYDINESCGHVSEDRWVSLDEIGFTYGHGAAALISPMVGNSGYTGMSASLWDIASESITPWRSFGGNFGPESKAIQAYSGYCFDQARKSALLVDMQHKVRVWRRYIMDMETGELEPVPESCDDKRLQEILAYAAAQFGARGKASPLRVIRRMGNRIRWTTMVGDIVIYDKWGPYDSYTQTGYFPYFRRGATRGAMENLIDPQDEINKQRNASIDHIQRMTSSGWMYHESSLSSEEEDKLEKLGSAPGYHMKWRGDPSMRPTQIQPPSQPIAFDRLAERAENDLRDISGINKDLLGMDDTVKSGRAIEARQRQGVMSIQMYMDNMSRTKELCARKRLEVYQTKYTEKRSFRIFGDQGKSEILTINDRQAAAELANDITVGKYRISIDETPLSATYAAAQFEEINDLVEKGVLPKEALQGMMIDLSSLPHKDIIKKNVSAINKAAGLPTMDDIESGNVGALTKGEDGEMSPAGQGEEDPQAQQQAQQEQQARADADAAKQSSDDFRWKAELDAATKIEVAKITSKAALDGTVNASIDAAAQTILKALKEQSASAQAQQAPQPAQMAPQPQQAQPAPQGAMQ